MPLEMRILISVPVVHSVSGSMDCSATVPGAARYSCSSSTGINPASSNSAFAAPASIPITLGT